MCGSIKFQIQCGDCSAWKNQADRLMVEDDFRHEHRRVTYKYTTKKLKQNSGSITCTQRSRQWHAFLSPRRLCELRRKFEFMFWNNLLDGCWKRHEMHTASNHMARVTASANSHPRIICVMCALMKTEMNFSPLFQSYKCTYNRIRSG